MRGPTTSPLSIMHALLALMCFMVDQAQSFVGKPPVIVTKKNCRPMIHHQSITREQQVVLRSSRGDEQQQEIDVESLKVQLQEYLQKRKDTDADNTAKQQVGKVVGGTKGNPVLEFVSGSPNKEYVIDEVPNVFDYDELERYGYGKLTTAIMKAGGRNAMYDLLGMERPPPPKRLKPKSAPKLVIDRTGETDQGRYKGLRMGQVLDDETMSEALAQAQLKAKSGERLRPKIQEEEYVMPFADKRNVGPKMTPDWTPEMLDEAGRKRGQAQAWARRAKMGEFIGDPFETLDLQLPLRLYAIFSSTFIAFAFGRATPNLFSRLDIPTDSLNLLQAPALAMFIASLGSSIVCGVVLAPPRKRNAFVWGIKGLLGGPVALTQLRGLETLITNEEKELQDLAKSKQQQT